MRNFILILLRSFCKNVERMSNKCQDGLEAVCVTIALNPPVSSEELWFVIHFFQSQKPIFMTRNEGIRVLFQSNRNPSL